MNTNFDLRTYLASKKLFESIDSNQDTDTSKVKPAVKAPTTFPTQITKESSLEEDQINEAYASTTVPCKQCGAPAMISVEYREGDTGLMGGVAASCSNNHYSNYSFEFNKYGQFTYLR